VSRARTANRRLGVLLAVALVLAAPRAFAETTVLADRALAIGHDVVDEQRRGEDARAALVDFVDQSWETIVFTAMAREAMSADPVLDHLTEPFRLRYQALTETSLTDKHVGATSSASGTTSLFDKPSLAKLLGLAIEHGAIEQESEGTSVTLSTTPYALTGFGFTGEDTAESYQRWGGALHKVGMSATFGLDEGKTVADLDFGTLSQVQVKINPWSRDPRDPAYTQKWNEQVRPAVEERLQASTGALADLYADPREPSHLEARRIADETRERLLSGLDSAPFWNEVEAIDASSDADAMRSASQAIADHLVAFLENVVAPEARSLALERQDEIRDRLVPELIRTQKAQLRAEADFRSFLEEWNARKSLSAAWTLHRVSGGSDYSEVLLAAQKKFAKADFNLNLSSSFYHSPDGSLDQDTVRGYGVSLGIEGSMRNVVFGRLNPENLAPITFSFSGKYQRLDEKSANIGVVQFKTNVPIGSGFTLPLALTYNSRTDQDSSDEFRINVGVDLDTDKLRALLRLAGR
jgi:hypothetical protein